MSFPESQLNIRTLQNLIGAGQPEAVEALVNQCFEAGLAFPSNIDPVGLLAIAHLAASERLSDLDRMMEQGRIRPSSLEPQTPNHWRKKALGHFAQFSVLSKLASWGR